jgi:hypothetical protein
VSNPYGGGPDQPGRIRGGAVAGGIVLGIVGTIVWMTIVFVAVLSVSSEGDTGAYDWLIGILFFLPLPVSILLLVFRRTRQAAAGFVMGLAIGTLVLAGLCSGTVLLPSLGA